MLTIKNVSYEQSGVDVSTWIERWILHTGNDGAIERAQETADNCAEAVGRLIAVLAEKGILTAPEVHYIARGFPDDEATFERN